MVRNAVEKSVIFKEPRVGKKGCSIAETVEDGRHKRRKKGREKNLALHQNGFSLRI